MAAELWRNLTEEEKNRFYTNVLSNLPTGDSLMLKFRKDDKVQALRDLVDLCPEGIPTMIEGEAINRIQQADPGASISQIINGALEEYAKAAESSELARKKRSHKLDRALEMVRSSLVKLLAAEARLEAGVQCSADAQAIDDILSSSYRKVRTAGSNIRNAYSLRSKTLRSNPRSPRGRMTPRRFY